MQSKFWVSITLIATLLLVGSRAANASEYPGNPFSLALSGGISAGTDPLYSFSFFDLDDNEIAHGSLATEVVGGQAYENVLSGSITYQGESYLLSVTGWVAGNATPPPAPVSPKGWYQYDSLLYPAGSYAVDYYGLLFTGTQSGGTELNIYWLNDGSGHYSLDWRSGNDDAFHPTSGSFVLTPESSTLVLLLPALLPVTLLVRRRGA